MGDYWAWKRAQERKPKPSARQGMAVLEQAVAAAQADAKESEYRANTKLARGLPDILEINVRDGIVMIRAARVLPRRQLEIVLHSACRLLGVDAANYALADDAEPTGEARVFFLWVDEKLGG